MVVVLGLAKSGVSVAKLLHKQGEAVTVNDQKERELCPEADELDALGVSVICGGHPDNLITGDTTLVVKNPGIPYSAAPVRRALELGVPVVTEVEVAYGHSPAPIIGITGSNGKTTTTTWVGDMLEAAGLPFNSEGLKELSYFRIEPKPEQIRSEPAMRNGMILAPTRISDSVGRASLPEAHSRCRWR